MSDFPAASNNVSSHIFYVSVVSPSWNEIPKDDASRALLQFVEQKAAGQNAANAFKTCVLVHNLMNSGSFHVSVSVAVCEPLITSNVLLLVLGGFLQTHRSVQAAVRVCE